MISVIDTYINQPLVRPELSFSILYVCGFYELGLYEFQLTTCLAGPEWLWGS